jgi:hypothetical protein
MTIHVKQSAQIHLLGILGILDNSSVHSQTTSQVPISETQNSSFTCTSAFSAQLLSCTASQPQPKQTGPYSGRDFNSSFFGPAFLPSHLMLRLCLPPKTQNRPFQSMITADATTVQEGGGSDRHVERLILNRTGKPKGRRSSSRDLQPKSLT